jgi:hypothetical protein
MTLEHIFFVSQSVAAVGVVASLIFVGLQVRGSAKAVRSATAQSVQDSYANWYVSLACNENALAASLKGLVDLEALTAAEKAQFYCTYMAYLSNARNAFHQWREGHLANDLWTGWEALLMNFVKTPGGAAFWHERSFVFGQDFQNEVKAIMSREQNPLVKVLGVIPYTPRASTEETDGNSPDRHSK